MHPIAQPQRPRMVRGRVTDGRIGIGAALGEDGSTIDNEVKGAGHLHPEPGPYQQHEEQHEEPLSDMLPTARAGGFSGYVCPNGLR
jgi:hypothetical protein